MNTIRVALAVVAMLAAGPTFAQPSRHASSRQTIQQSATISPDAVFVAGRYIGQDPDPQVRAELRRNYNDHLSN